MKKLKIIFSGTNYFSAEYLKSLINSSHHVISIISQPDRPSGRGQKIHFSPVKILSQDNNIPILQPLNINTVPIYNQLHLLQADIMIIVAYGQKVSKKIINMFPYGCINVHASLLPRWRGATPIQSSILNGDQETGVTIIKINEQIDKGKILNFMKCNIDYQDTTLSLSWKLIIIGVPLLLKTLKQIQNNLTIEIKQNEKYSTTSKKIYKKDAKINWNIPALQLERMIRAFNPWPICYFIIKKNIIKVWKAKIIPIVLSTSLPGKIVCFNKNGIQVNTSHQILNIQKLQLSGKKITDAANLLKSKQTWFHQGTFLQ